MKPGSNVPKSMKQLGPKIFGYVLNLSDDLAGASLEGHYELDEARTAILSQFINLYKQLWVASIESTNVEVMVNLQLADIYSAGHHIFNVWRSQLGGQPLK